MRVTILAPGTRGDAQPHVALALGLKSAGHSVCLATNAAYASMVRERGIEYAPFDFNPNADFPTVKTTLRDARFNIVQLARARSVVAQAVQPLANRLFDEAWAACKASDAIICTHLGTVGHVIAERLGVPSLYSGLTPLSPTGEFPPYTFPNFPTGSRRANQAAYALSRRVIWLAGRPILNQWRQRAQLQPLALSRPRERLLGSRHPWLYGFSSAVVPKPADWGDWRHVTGYWFLDDDGSWKPPAPLLQFLKGGPPPVVISFGSTRTHDPEALAGTAIAALTSSGRRGILVTGGGGIQAETLPPTVAQVPAVPFDWLFPRSAAAVHHGGAGTTAAGLRAGVPTVVTPFFNEQRFWARRVHTLGAGPAPLRWRGLTPAKLNDAIEEAITSQSIRDRAAGVGALIRGENGPQRAVEVFEHYVQTWAPAR